MIPVVALLGADRANTEGLTPESVALGPDGLRRQATLAAGALGLTTKVLERAASTPDDVLAIRDAMVAQVNYQVTLGVGLGERVADSESRGARSVTWSAQRRVAPGAAEALADLLGRYGASPWGAAVTTLRPRVGRGC